MSAVRFFCGFALVVIGAMAAAQSPVETPAKAPNNPRTPADPSTMATTLQAAVPAARIEDVGSIDAIMVAIYDVISGPAGKRDWNRFRSLMLPQGRLAQSMVDEQGHTAVSLWSVDEFIAESDPFFTGNAFYETGLVNRVQRFGNVAQVFTSYESRSTPSGAPFQRGINSMQLMFDGKRWWVLSILWDIERPGNPIPKEMLR